VQTQTLPASVKTDTTNNKTTLTRQAISLFLDINQPDFGDTQANPKVFKIFSSHIFKSQFIADPQIAHLGLPRHTKPTLRKTKRAFF
jgi:hypothetical protein